MESNTQKKFSKTSFIKPSEYQIPFPMLFDDTLTQLQKMNKIIYWLNELGLLTNEMIDYLNNFIEKFDEKLYTNMDSILQKWLDDGIISNLINNEYMLQLNPSSHGFKNILGVWEEFEQRGVNVKWFGAKGDGSTNDTLSFQNAIKYCIENNLPLLIPKGQYIANVGDTLHNVHLLGEGIINEGLHATQYYDTTTTLYVSYAYGNDSNDGLKNTTAFRTIQKAFDVLTHYANPELKGQWIIQLDNGNFQGGTLKDGLQSEKPIIIQGTEVGAHPIVPTSVITNGIGVSSYGIMARDNIKLKVRNIKFVGYNGSTSSAGIVVSNGCNLETENVHTDRCYWGISGQKSNIEIPDGIHENNGFINGQTNGGGAAIRSLMLNRHAIGKQNNGNRNDTVIIRNCQTGVFSQESSTGHVDWCTIEGCTNGVQLNVSSRANVDGTEFKDNFRAIREIGNSHCYVSNNVVFTNNQASIVTSSGSELTTFRLFDGIDVSYSTIDKIFKTEYVNKDISNATSESYYTLNLKAPFWKNAVNTITPMKKISFKIYGQVINNTGEGGSGTKQINVRLGSSLVGATIGITEEGIFSYEGSIHFVNETTQFMFLQGGIHLSANRISRNVVNEDMSVDKQLRFEAQTNQVLDKVHIDLIEIRYGA